MNKKPSLFLIGALCLLVGVAATVKFSELTPTLTIHDADYFPVIHDATNATVTVNALAANLATNDALANNLAVNPALATNFTRAPRRTIVTGTGGALTNFTLIATNGEIVIAVKTNVSIRGVMVTDPTVGLYWTLHATNLSGADRTLEFSPVTNHFHFVGSTGTNAPDTLTNGFRFVANGCSEGSNTLVTWTFFPCP